MIYLAAIFISPLALLLVGKWFQAILNLVLYIAAWLLVITFFFAWIGAVCWAVGVVHAVLVINSHKAEKRHQEMLTAMGRSQ
jgi:hypothetical protein